MKVNKHTQSGFTLVEIIVSIAIFGIIAAIFIPAMAFTFRHLVDSEKFVIDSYASQQDVEKILEQKRSEPTGVGSQTIQVFGVSVTGHLITENISGHGQITVFQPPETTPYDVPEIIANGHAGNPDVLMTVVGTSPTPAEINMFDGSGNLNPAVFYVDYRKYKVDDPLIHLMSVYKWFVSSEQNITSIATLDNYAVIKEWNAARGLVSYAESETLHITPNNQTDTTLGTDYERFKFSEVVTGLSLSNEALINRFGNRYLYYSVTPYAISGRIGKEDLSNAVYIRAPRIEIDRAYFGTNNKQVEVVFKSNISQTMNKDLIQTNASLGNLVSATRSTTDSKIMILEFENPISSTSSISGNELIKGAIASETYGYISIWSNDHPKGTFTIDTVDTVYATSLTLTPETASLYVGQTQSLSAAVLPANVTHTTVSWESNRPDIATVDANGLVTAISVGSATITATSGDGRKSDTCLITVTALPPAIQPYLWPSDMVAKLDASIGLEYSSGIWINRWNDQSGHNNHFYQTNSSNQPGRNDVGLNGFPTITFNPNSDEYLTLNNDAFLLNGIDKENLLCGSSNQFSMFIVGKASTRSTEYSTFISKSNGWTTSATYNFGLGNTTLFTHTIRGNSTNRSTGNNNFNIHSSTWTGTMHQYWLNGVEKTAHNNIGNAGVQNRAVVIGASAEGSNDHLSGDIAEVIVFDRALIDTERAVVEQYMNKKWFTAPVKTWNFNSSTESWTSGGNVSGFGASSGFITGTLSGNDPFVTSPIFSQNVDANKYILLRLRNNTTSTKAQIYFTTTQSTGWNEAKHVDFEIKPNSGYTDYLILMGSNVYWTGTLTQLRIDPTTDVNSGSFGIDYVRILP